MGGGTSAAVPPVIALGFGSGRPPLRAARALLHSTRGGGTRALLLYHRDDQVIDYEGASLHRALQREAGGAALPAGVEALELRGGWDPHSAEVASFAPEAHEATVRWISEALP